MRLSQNFTEVTCSVRRVLVDIENRIPSGEFFPPDWDIPLRLRGAAAEPVGGLGRKVVVHSNKCARLALIRRPLQID